MAGDCGIPVQFIAVSEGAREANMESRTASMKDQDKDPSKARISPLCIQWKTAFLPSQTI